MARERASFLERLRRRPRHERSILAAALYATAAAVVVAIWIGSVRNTLNERGAPAELSAGAEASSTRHALSPLGAVAENARVIAAEFWQALNALGKSALQDPGRESTRTDTSPETRGIETAATEAKPPKVQKPPAPGALAGSGGTAAIIAGQLGSKPPPVWRDLRANFATRLKTKAVDENGITRIRSVISYNLSEFARAAADFARYLGR